MSGVPLETCWAFNKLWNNKFYYKAASCWYFYWVCKLDGTSITRLHSKNFLLLNTTRMAEKIFPPKNLVYGFWRENFFPFFPSNFPTLFLSPLTFLPFPLLAATTASTSRRSCSSSYQMSLLSRIVGSNWNLGVAGPSFYPLDLVMNYEVKEF